MRLAVVLVVGVVVGGGLLITPGAADSTGPTIDVDVDDENIEPEATVDRRHDPSITIATKIENESAGQIELISVELDGATYETFDVNATSISKEINPELSQGPHEFNVIVKDSEGNVETFGFEVTKDSLKPKVWLTEPFQTEPRESIADRSIGDVTDNTLVFHGHVEEDTFPYEVSINRNNNQSGAGETVTSQFLNESFSLPVTLGPGKNEIELKVIDGVGNHQVKRFSITVHDKQPPHISTTSSLAVNASSTTLRAEITDNFGVKSVSFEAEDYSQPNLIVREDPSWKQSHPVEFTKEVDLDIGFNYFTILAEDGEGNQGKLFVEIERLEPTDDRSDHLEILVDEEQTGFTAHDHLAVNGTVSGGEIVFAQIQAVDETGDTVDIVSLHDGDPVVELGIDAILTVGEQDTQIIIEVHDGDDTVRKEAFWVNGAQQEVFIQRKEKQDHATPTPTATPTQTDDASDADTPTRTRNDTPRTQGETTSEADGSGAPATAVPRTTAPGMDGFGFAMLVVSVMISVGYWLRKIE